MGLSNTMPKFVSMSSEYKDAVPVRLEIGDAHSDGVLRGEKNR